MARIESSVIVSKTTKDVFAFLSKRESHLNFIPRMIELKQTSMGDFAQVGGTAEGMLNYVGIKIPVTYEIIENEVNRRIAMKGAMPFVDFKDGYVLSEQNDGTEVKFWLELNLTGWMKIFSPFAGLIGKVHAWETLRNLKREIASSSLRASSQ